MGQYLYVVISRNASRQACDTASTWGACGQGKLSHRQTFGGQAILFWNSILFFFTKLEDAWGSGSPLFHPFFHFSHCGFAPFLKFYKQMGVHSAWWFDHATLGTSQEWTLVTSQHLFCSNFVRKLLLSNSSRTSTNCQFPKSNQPQHVS